MRRDKRMKNRRILPTETEPRVGTLYRNIAKKRLVESGAMVLPYDIEEMLVSCQYKTVETYMNLEPFMWLLYDKLGEVLAKYKMTLPHDFVDVVLHNEAPDDDFEEVTIGVNMLELSEMSKCVLALRCLREMHDEWIRGHVEEFGGESIYDQVQFMPFCLIGSQGVKDWYAFAEDILAVLGLAPDYDYLMEFYEAWRDYVLNQNNVFTKRDALILVANLSPESVAQKMSEDEDFADKVIEEVIERI